MQLTNSVSHKWLEGSAWLLDPVQDYTFILSLQNFISEIPTFLLYINDLNQAIKFCKVHHFADDTNLLYFGKCMKKLNKLVNYDLKNLVYWLKANKISLNA